METTFSRSQRRTVTSAPKSATIAGPRTKPLWLFVHAICSSAIGQKQRQLFVSRWRRRKTPSVMTPR